MEFAPRIKGADVTDDTALLRWARRRRYILVRHDKTRDKRTRLELYPEVYHHGGKIIRIGGGPDQDALIATGKILVHLDEWQEFFEENDGMVVVHKQGMRKLPSHALYAQVQGTLDAEQVTGRRVIKPSRPRKPQPKPPPVYQRRFPTL